MNIEFHGDMTLERFFREWFGIYGGRELGTNKYGWHRKFTDNPDQFIEFIRMTMGEHETGEFCRPAWITAQPFGAYDKPIAIEKLFFDFDDDTEYCKLCDKYHKKDNLVKGPFKGKNMKLCPVHKVPCEVKPRKDVVGKEVKKFVSRITKYEPIISETRKGFHVNIFLYRVFTFSEKHTEFAKEVYRTLQERFFKKGEFEFLDERVIGDIKRLARVPLTPHEKTGELCWVLDRNLKKTKVRSVEYYRQYGIQESIVKWAISVVKTKMEKKAEEEKLRAEQAQTDISNGGEFHGIIRPCFQARIDQGVMSHPMRLALLVEAYFSGLKTEDQLVDLFRSFADFKESVTRYQVRWFLEHSPDKYPPYKCSTMISKNWCIESSCPIYRRKFISK
jgi:hypothetical protein